MVQMARNAVDVIDGALLLCSDDAIQSSYSLNNASPRSATHSVVQTSMPLRNVGYAPSRVSVYRS